MDINPFVVGLTRTNLKYGQSFITCLCVWAKRNQKVGGNVISNKYGNKNYQFVEFALWYVQKV